MSVLEEVKILMGKVFIFCFDWVLFFCLRSPFFSDHSSFLEKEKGKGEAIHYFGMYIHEREYHIRTAIEIENQKVCLSFSYFFSLFCFNLIIFFLLFQEGEEQKKQIEETLEGLLSEFRTRNHTSSRSRFSPFF